MPPIDWEKLSLITFLGLTVTAFLKGWVVPGNLYRRAVKDAADLLKVNAKLATSIERLTRAR